MLGLSLVILATVWMDRRFINGTFENGASDYGVFWRAVRGDPYALSDMPFAYPPTALIFFKPLELVPYQAGLYIWVGLSIAAFILAVSRASSWPVALLSLPSAAVFSTMTLGQVSLLLGSIIIGAFTVAPFWGGMLLAIAAGVKPQMLLFAPLALIVRRDWQMLRGAVAGGAIILALTLLDFGLWARWIEMLPHFRAVVLDPDVAYRLVTPYGRFQEWPYLALGIVAGAAAVIAASRKVEGPYLAGLIVAASLVASPYAHLHDLTPLIPACVLLMLSGPRIAAVAGALLYVGFIPTVAVVLLVGMVWLAAQTALRDWPRKAGRTSQPPEVAHPAD
jgi:hypothetical protein